jgi:hypothetical protein
VAKGEDSLGLLARYQGRVHFLLIKLSVAFTAAVTLTLGSLACTADPPRIVYQDVVDFWVTPVKASELDYPFYYLGERPYFVVENYNRASGHSFDHGAPTMLRAGIALKDGTTVRLEFSKEWPEDCLLVYVDPPGRKPEPLETRQLAVSQEDTPYEAKAPGLAVLVFNIAGQHINPEILGPWLWPRL